jgi:hypothetical protein
MNWTLPWALTTKSTFIHSAQLLAQVLNPLCSLSLADAANYSFLETGMATISAMTEDCRHIVHTWNHESSLLDLACIRSTLRPWRSIVRWCFWLAMLLLYVVLGGFKLRYVRFHAERRIDT